MDRKYRIVFYFLVVFVAIILAYVFFNIWKINTNNYVYVCSFSYNAFGKGNNTYYVMRSNHGAFSDIYTLPKGGGGTNFIDINVEISSNGAYIFGDSNPSYEYMLNRCGGLPKLFPASKFPASNNTINSTMNALANLGR